MNLLQRWILMLVIILINTEVFDINNWEFWVIGGGIGAVCSPLYNKQAIKKQ